MIKKIHNFIKKLFSCWCFKKKENRKDIYIDFYNPTDLDTILYDYDNFYGQIELSSDV